MTSPSETVVVAYHEGRTCVIADSMTSFDTPNIASLGTVLTRTAVTGNWIVTHEIDEMLAAAISSVGIDVFIFETSAYLQFRCLSPERTSAATVAGLPPPPGGNCAEWLAQLAHRLLWMALSDAAFPFVEYSMIAITARANAQGLDLDTARARNLAARMQTTAQQLTRAAKTELGLPPSALQDDEHLQRWLEQHEGVKLSKLSKHHAPRHQVALQHARVARLMVLRDSARAATDLARAAGRAAQVRGGKAHLFLRYAGAHTGRFTSRPDSGIDVHGLMRDSDRMPGLGEHRRLIVAPEGTNLVAADLSSIEPRILAWLAGEHELLEGFRAGQDVYADFMQAVCPGVAISKSENSHLRDVGKIAVVSLGYLVRDETFADTIICEIPDVAPDLVRAVYESFHAQFPSISGLGDRLFEAFREALDGRLTSVGCVGLSVARSGHQRDVVVQLPTGRPIYYRGVVQERGFWYAPFLWLGPGVDPRPRRRGERRFDDGQWRTRVTPSVLVENITQAVARDVLVHMVVELERRGLPVLFTRHDEIVCTCEPCDCTALDGSHASNCAWSRAGETLVSVMSTIPATLPALVGLPVAAALRPSVRMTYA